MIPVVGITSNTDGVGKNHEVFFLRKKILMLVLLFFKGLSSTAKPISPFSNYLEECS
jgi:hypothetical protein